MSQAALRLARIRPSDHAMALLLATMVALSAVAILPSDDAAAGAGSRREQLRFMWAMAGQESNWDYYARNRESGAFGKYQIMPFNWPNWAAEYLGDARADQTPYNQEIVAYRKQRDLFRWLGSWKRVAYWWLTGRKDKNEKRWSAYARGYVENVMKLRKRAPARGAAMPPRTSSRPSRGDWRRSARIQKLYLAPGGRVWPARGSVRDGQVLKVRAVRTTGAGHRWIRVVTADGRLGWLKHLRTVPARKPKLKARWTDVTDRGEAPARTDRKMVRPKPR